jgi:hypothetical protein
MKIGKNSWLVGGAVALVLVACADDTSTPPNSVGNGGRLMTELPIEQVITFEPGTPVFVKGVLFEDANGLRLCEAIGESFPLSCLGSQIEVVDLDLYPDLIPELTGEGGVRTSQGEVTLPGFYGEGTLRVDPAAASADTPGL